MSEDAVSQGDEKALARELRIVRKQLERSEADRVQLEDTKDKNDSLLRKVIGELRDTHEEVARKRAELESTVEELRTTQSELIESAKMAALGELVAGVAHEVNTPLGVGVTAASHLDNLVKEFASHLNGESLNPEIAVKFVEGSRQSSEIILNNLRRAAELIASFKLVAVDQSFKSMREYNVHEYLGEIILSLSNRLKRSGVQVTVEGSDYVFLYGDPGLMSQVITNLVVNALTHAYEPGERGEICIGYEVQDDMLHMQFSDDGKGIDSEHLSKIYDPFFTTRRGKGGSGLGLNIVYNLIRRQMNGKIECQSELGKGTRFDIRVPLRAEMDEPAEARQQNG